MSVPSSYHYEYDADTNVSEEVITQDGKTLVQRYDYDTLGQLSQMTVLDKNKKNELATYVYTYDPAGNKISSVETINGNKQTTHFTYDEANRLITLKDGTQTIHYTYDKNGNRIKQSGTDDTQEYIYDTENRLLAVKDNKGLLMAALYDGDDNRVFTASRTEDKTSYQLFRRQEKKEPKNSQASSDKTNRRSPQTSPNGEENSLFWYGFTENVVQGLSGLPETVGHLWMSVFDTISRTYHQKIAKDRANKEGIVVNPPSLGDRPGEGKVTYSSEVKEVLIPYTSREDTHQYYDVRNYVNDVNQENTQVLQTYDDQSKPCESYTYGNDRLDYTNNQTDDTYQYLTDGKGSVTGLVTNDDVTNTMSYGAYGAPETSEQETATDTGNPYGYTGEAQDVAGLNYLRARYYDSTSGTFLTEDSYEGELETPLSQNAYTYVENNPINFTDPTGHKRNRFQRSWNRTRKAVRRTYRKARTVVRKSYNRVRRVVNTARRTVNNVRRNVRRVYNRAVPVVQRAGGRIRQSYTRVNQSVSKRWTNWSQRSAGPPRGNQRTVRYASFGGGAKSFLTTAKKAVTSSNFVSHSQKMATLNAQRQRRITSDYAKATGNKGKAKSKEGKNLNKNWNKSLKNTLKKFCSTSPKTKKQKTESVKQPKVPETKAEILRDYHWSTNSNMYVHTKTGIPSPEATKKYNQLVAAESSPKKDPRLEFFTIMLQTGKHPVTGQPISEAERANATYMTWGLAVQPIVGAVAASKLPQGKSTNSTEKKTTIGPNKNTGNQSSNTPQSSPLSDNAKVMMDKYEKNGWKGNVSGQTPKTAAGKTWHNDGSQGSQILQKNDFNGNSISYKEFDVNNKILDQPRDAERFLKGSDGSVYYTNDHYKTITKIK